MNIKFSVTLIFSKIPQFSAISLRLGMLDCWKIVKLLKILSLASVKLLTCYNICVHINFTNFIPLNKLEVLQNLEDFFFLNCTPFSQKVEDLWYVYANGYFHPKQSLIIKNMMTQSLRLTQHMYISIIYSFLRTQLGVKEDLFSII